MRKTKRRSIGPKRQKRRIDSPLTSEGSSIPAIPGCFSDGRSIAEARERVRDAILNFLEDLQESGESIPSDILHVERVFVSAE
jgi:predicted RNase H-like HicB family nuclease